MGTSQTSRPSDTAWAIAVPVAAVLALAGAFLGSGAVGGTPIAEAAGGALSADATMVAPAGPAFSIWSVVYLGLLAYAVYQLTPVAARDPRILATRPAALASMVLNAAWILSIQAGLLWWSVPIIVVLLVSLVAVLRTLRRMPRHATGGRGVVESVVVDGTFGLYLGWVTIATVANVAAALSASGFDGFGWAPDAWGVLLLLAAGVIGVGLAVWDGGRLAPSLTLSWGIAWIGVSRLVGTLESTPVAITAFAVAGLLLIATAVLRLTARGRAHPAR